MLEPKSKKECTRVNQQLKKRYMRKTQHKSTRPTKLISKSYQDKTTIRELTVLCTAHTSLPSVLVHVDRLVQSTWLLAIQHCSARDWEPQPCTPRKNAPLEVRNNV
eukprot:6455589-Amphidinium_carterae.1